MATSKRAHTTPVLERPDAAAFVQLIEDGRAGPREVDAAYRLAQAAWLESLTAEEQRDLAIGSVTQDRSDIDWDAATPEARLIAIHRQNIFKGDS